MRSTCSASLAASARSPWLRVADLESERYERPASDIGAPGIPLVILEGGGASATGPFARERVWEKPIEARPACDACRGGRAGQAGAESEGGFALEAAKRTRVR